MHLAIVIPTLEEETALRHHLANALSIADQVVVSDGGSHDGTTRVAAAAGALVVQGSPGRGQQLNRGADLALDEGCDVLLFLHADTRLPVSGREHVERLVEQGNVGGGFLVRFDERPLLLRLGERLINARTRLLRVPLGDQAQFVSRRAFESLGGFADWPILEDLDLILRLRRLGRVGIVKERVVTSARRFTQHGTLRTVATNWLIWLLYFSGIEPHKLGRLYRHVR